MQLYVLSHFSIENRMVRNTGYWFAITGFAQFYSGSFNKQNDFKFKVGLKAQSELGFLSQVSGLCKSINDISSVWTDNVALCYLCHV